MSDPFLRFPLADIIANDPAIHVIKDLRVADGCIFVVCPNGREQHPPVVVSNPNAGAPARISCLHPDCAQVSTVDFVALIRPNRH